MISRRSFLLRAAAWCSVPVALRMRPLAAKRIRIATIIAPARTDFERGIVFGATEADRSATMFGWRVERVAGPAAPADPDDVTATVIATDAALPRTGGATLLAACRTDVRGFRLVPDAACGGDDARERVVLWDASLVAFGARELNDRYRVAYGADMTSDAWLGWFSMKLVTEAALRARSADPAAVTAYLRRPTSEFDGHKGVPLRFDTHDMLVQPVYRLARDTAGRWTLQPAHAGGPR